MAEIPLENRYCTILYSQHEGVDSFILGEGNKLPVMEEESDRMMQYGTVLMEIVWMTCKVAVKEKDIPTWEELTKLSQIRSPNTTLVW